MCQVRKEVIVYLAILLWFLSVLVLDLALSMDIVLAPSEPSPWPVTNGLLRQLDMMM